MLKFATAVCFSFLFGFSSLGNAGPVADLKAEYEETSLRAAKAAYEVTWGSRSGETFAVKYEIVERQFMVSHPNITGKYKVRVMMEDGATKWSDRGIDIVVEIFDGAALKMEVDCRTCG